MTQFYGKTKICYGPYALETLETFPASHAFVVTDPFMVKSGFADQAVSHLKRKGIGHTLFSGVEPDPSLQAVVEATRLFLSSQADMIIAIGGGSAIDMAKAISYFGHKADSNRKTTLVAIPTTSGTGSEVTSIAVITDKVNSVKIPLNDEMLIPDAAILDARFTRTVPPHVTAATGMDALTHAIEGYITKGAWAMSDMFHLKAIEIISKSLRGAVENTPEGREGMALGQYVAGMGFSNVGLGIVHSMAHPLGALYDTPHGVANAIILPTVMEYNAPATGEKYRDIAKAMGVEGTENMSVDEYRKAAVDAVRQLAKDVGIPADLKAIVKPEDVDFLAQSAYDDACRPGNPRDTSVAELAELYRSLM